MREFLVGDDGLVKYEIWFPALITDLLKDSLLTKLAGLQWRSQRAGNLQTGLVASLLTPSLQLYRQLQI